MACFFVTWLLKIAIFTNCVMSGHLLLNIAPDRGSACKNPKWPAVTKDKPHEYCTGSRLCLVDLKMARRDKRLTSWILHRVEVLRDQIQDGGPWLKRIQTFFAFPQPQYVLTMFLNLGNFSAPCSYRKGSCKKKSVISELRHWKSTKSTQYVSWSKKIKIKL